MWKYVGEAHSTFLSYVNISMYFCHKLSSDFLLLFNGKYKILTYSPFPICRKEICFIPQRKKINLAAMRPFWKWHQWKSIGFIPYTKVMCYWTLDLIFRAKLKLESGNWKIQYGCQAAILKMTSREFMRLRPMATGIMHIKFEIGILKQTRVMQPKPCHLLSPGPRLNIKTVLSTYGDFHVKDKTAVRTSYL